MNIIVWDNELVRPDICPPKSEVIVSIVSWSDYFAFYFENYYPLAQQSCGGDIGSVLYVCMCVRMYVLSYVHLLSLL